MTPLAGEPVAFETYGEGYCVRFDGSSENACGDAVKSAVHGHDSFCAFLRPQKEEGELVLRLERGDTGAKGNSFRLYNLSVDEVGELEVAARTSPVLVSGIDCHGQDGFIKTWVFDGCGVRMSSDASSATMTVTENPEESAEVWKIKLLAATGVTPVAGRDYRFTAELTSTSEADYEICYNEGEIEKGYDVVYGQRLSAGTVTVERTICVSADKEDPGELIIQFSLGFLKVGESVTLSNINLSEAEPTFMSVLPEGYSLGKTWEVDERTYGTALRQSSTPENITIAWQNQTAVTKSGDRAGELSLTADSASIRRDLRASRRGGKDEDRQKGISCA